MDTKIYTPSAPRPNKNEINMQQISNENDIKKYLSYVYQEYGDIYELNLIKDENNGTLTSENSKSQVSATGNISQSSCNIFCFCFYFLYATVTSIISVGLSSIAAFLLFDTKYKVFVAVIIFMVCIIVFLLGSRQVKKIISKFFEKNEVIYDV